MSETDQKSSNTGGILMGLAAIITAIGGFIIAIKHELKPQPAPVIEAARKDTPSQPPPAQSTPVEGTGVRHARTNSTSNAHAPDEAEPNFSDIAEVTGSWHPTAKDQAMTLHLTFGGFHKSGYMDSPCAGVNSRVNLETAVFSEDVLQISYRNVQTQELFRRRHVSPL